MGKVHGSLARNGKVRNQAPKVAKAERAKKRVKGRAAKRLQYNRRINGVDVNDKRRKGPNFGAGRKPEDIPKWSNTLSFIRRLTATPAWLTSQWTC